MSSEGYILVITGTRRQRKDTATQCDAVVAEYGIPRLVVVGDATGVDRAAYFWASRRGYAIAKEVVDPSTPSPQKFHDRNQRMVGHAGLGDICLGLPDEKSRGTFDCLSRAKNRGMTCLIK